MTDASSAEQGRPNIRDVARTAGVSVATVSRVLTGSRGVRQESADAVLAAVERLQYRPNQLGRALRRQSIQAVGMIVPRVDNPFFPTVVQFSEQYLRSKGYALLLCTSNDDPDIERQRIEMLVDRRVDGLLVSPCHRLRSGAAIADAAQRVPVVELDRGTDGYPGDFVAVDDADGIGQLVAHLRDTGRSELAFVGGEATSWSGARRAAAFTDHEPDADAAGRVLLGEFSEEWGESAGRRLLGAANPPDAVVCGNDLIAMGVLTAADDLDLDVPGDVAVTGYDDIDLARLCRPPLTTVRQPVQDLVHHAIDVLLTRLAGTRHEANRLFLPTKLVVRTSTTG